MKKYINRIQDDVLQNLLSSSGAVLIEGPKWCGKTWLGRHSAKSEIDLQDPDKGARSRQRCRVQKNGRGNAISSVKRKQATFDR